MPRPARNWPSSTVKLADLTAWNVPKDLSSASTLICAIAPYARTFDTMVNITVPNRVVANDQEYSVRKNGCISMTTPAAMIVKFQGNKVKEIHHYFDMVSFLQQIGAMPGMATRA